MSLRIRLILLISVLIAVALGTIISALVFEAGPRVADETTSMARVSRDLINTSIDSMQESSDPRASLRRMVERMRGLRHVRVELEGEPTRDATPSPSRLAEPPGWFTAPLRETFTVERVPVIVRGERVGVVSIAAAPGDEIREVWSAITEVAEGGLLLALAALALTSVLISRALKPIGDIGDGLARLEAGATDVAIPVAGPPEIAAICRRLNHLAATLQQTREDNRELSTRIIRVQDEERADITRELHDELGPHYFAMRAAATMLSGEIAKDGADRTKLAALAETLATQLESVQRTNRRVLQKLRPPGLDELGLKESLDAVATMLAAQQPDTNLEMAIDDSVDTLDPTTRLTIYRVVQEGLTNAYRHAAARHVAVRVVCAAPPPDPLAASLGAAMRGVSITITDDGRGLSARAPIGHGIAGMSQRVRALGGRFEIATGTNGGVALSAWIPALERLDRDGE